MSDDAPEGTAPTDQVRRDGFAAMAILVLTVAFIAVIIISIVT